jgi:hypothetical protein
MEQIDQIGGTSAMGGKQTFRQCSRIFENGAEKAVARPITKVAAH